jgi:hypothetical protein
VADPARLRARLHELADALADVLEEAAGAPAPRRRSPPAAVVASDTDRAFARAQLRRRGWPAPPEGKAR